MSKLRAYARQDAASFFRSYLLRYLRRIENEEGVRHVSRATQYHYHERMLGRDYSWNRFQNTSADL